jgi:hypothetical protein
MNFFPSNVVLKLYMLNKLSNDGTGGGAAATTFVVGAVPATLGASLDILFRITILRAPTPPTAVKFFFEGMSPVLLDGIFINDWFGVYIIKIINIIICANHLCKLLLVIRHIHVFQ